MHRLCEVKVFRFIPSATDVFCEGYPWMLTDFYEDCY